MKPILSLVLAALLAINTSAAQAGWVASWQASPQPVWGKDFAFPTGIPDTVRQMTFTQNVKVSRGGDRLRIVVSNRYGTSPLVVEQTTVRNTPGGGGVTDAAQTILFGGRTSVTIAPGSEAMSDPLDRTVIDGQQLQIAHYVKAETALKTFHWDGRQQAVFRAGNQTSKPMLSNADATFTTQARVFLTRIDTESDQPVCAVAVLGDSITDGNGVPIDSNARLTDYMATNLKPIGVAVVNAGISGARLLRDAMGENAIARIRHDVFDVPGVKTLVIFIGINDISWPGTAFAPALSSPSIESLQTGYRTLAHMARKRGLRVIAVTLTPFRGALSGTPLDNYYNAQKDQLRTKINEWLRHADVFDEVVDADRLLSDHADTTRLDAHFDSGDHLHPGPAGNEELARAISQRLGVCR